MLSAWINQITQPKLLNVAQALKIGVLNDVINQLVSDGDEAINRIVDDFLFVHFQNSLLMDTQLIETCRPTKKTRLLSDCNIKLVLIGNEIA